MIESTAPGKVILFGEHAVVYGQPAIAIPVSQLRTRVMVTEDTPHPLLDLPDLGSEFVITPKPQEGEEPLLAAVREVQTHLQLATLPNVRVRLTSDIPIASGLGSGAAAACAIVRGLLRHLGQNASNELVNQLVYNVEKLYHGTPSGIDNTVVTYERPVYFTRRQPENLIEPFKVGAPLHLIIADTGVKSPTKLAVGDVRQLWEQEPARLEQLFAACGAIAMRARTAIEHGRTAEIGELMNENHLVLRKMTVSSAELDHLVKTANAAGALGAKMSGGGRGGNMLALVTEERRAAVTAALAQHAQHVLHTVLS